MTQTTQKRSNFLHREPFLLAALLVLIAGFFVFTSFAAKSYRHQEESFGESWYHQGEQALSQGRASEAVEDFRNALAYSRDNDRYRLRLAQALIADQRPQEARAHLLSLWEREPGDGTVNLELARLEGRRGELGQALRYYHGAIYGVWPEEPSEHRWETRFEVSEFLLGRQANAQAQSELLALAASLPRDDAARQTRLGNLFLRAGLDGRALTAFRNALQAQPKLPAALAGAGEAAFHAGDYRTALSYLRRAAQEDPQNQHASDLLTTAGLVLELDPFQPRLPAKERARRVVHDFQTALERLQGCTQKAGSPADPSLASLYQEGTSRKRRVQERVLARDSDALEGAMEFAFQMEQAAERHCGAATGEDLALLLIARKREAER